MSEREVHPVAGLFPMLADDELAELAEDIKRRGLIQPIVLDEDGRVLDGRNRLAACEMAGVTPEFVGYHGDDPDGYALAVNIARRHLSTGARAMIAAKAGRLNGMSLRDAAERYNLYHSRLSEAEAVLDWAPDLADAVIAGAKPLSVAVETARAKKHQAEELAAKMDRLRSDAPDLLALVEEGRMDIDDASAALDAREEKARKEEAERQALIRDQEQTERLAYQQALNAYNAAVDGLTAALSYAQAYKPPDEIPDNYLSVEGFNERIQKLTELAAGWSDR